VFGSGTRTTVAVSVLVRSASRTDRGELHYRDIGDYLSASDKLNIVGATTLARDGNWATVVANEQGDWANSRNAIFETFYPLAGEIAGRLVPIFSMDTSGAKTNRDAWVYDSSLQTLRQRTVRALEFYEEQKARHKAGEEISNDPSRIAWGGSLRGAALAGREVQVEADACRIAAYRPFNAQHLVFSPLLNERRYRLPEVFPSSTSTNIGFVVTSPASHYPSFAALAANHIPDLHLLDTGHFYSRYRYSLSADDANSLTGFESREPERIDNISDNALAQFRGWAGNELTKDDIFYYVYGILHSTEYRTRYAADLKKMLPRIPKVKQFREFSDAGRKLADLHINYETVAAYPLVETATSEDPDLRVTKMRFAGKRPNVDKSTIVYNDQITLSGIPDEAHEYMLGSRSAIEWILERYQVKTDKPSGIVNDPNDWGLEHGNPRYILDLLKSIVTVSVETVKLVNSLPPLEILED
jgi:predicted helicase